MTPKFLFAPVALAALLCTGAANATFTIYNTQASYLAAIGSPGVDTFNDLTIASTPTPLSRTAGAYSYTAEAGPLSNFYPAGTLTDVWLATNNRTDTITFSAFTSTVRGVGGFFFRTDVNGAVTTTAATLNVTATDASGTVTQALVNPTPTTFLGFVSTGPISSVTVFVGTAGTGTAGVWQTVNNLTLGVAAIPEPQTYALLLGGLALVGWTARRKLH